MFWWIFNFLFVIRTRRNPVEQDRRQQIQNFPLKHEKKQVCVEESAPRRLEQMLVPEGNIFRTSGWKILVYDSLQSNFIYSASVTVQSLQSFTHKQVASGRKNPGAAPGSCGGTLRLLMDRWVKEEKKEG